MQGTLTEIDLRSILQLIQLGQRTGVLLVESYRPWTLEKGQHQAIFNRAKDPPFLANLAGTFWLVFFVNGEIVYAIDGSNPPGTRLQQYLYRYQQTIPPQHLTNFSGTINNDLEYSYLWHLIEQNLLNPAQGRNLIQQMVRESLFDLLSLHQGTFIFEIGVALAPLLTSLEIAPLVQEIMKEVQQWKQLYPQIQSPQQCLRIIDNLQLQNALPSKAYQRLSLWADGKTSLRQLSHHLQRDLGTLGRGIYPYIERGWLQVVEPPSQQSLPLQSEWEWQETVESPHIVCIDDDLTIGKSVESMVTQNGYRSTVIVDPLKALSWVFEIKPDLILCDIAMPKLDGYQICTMLRHSSAFRQVPIIMLTGKEGFVERLRARMVGATDYLTKPFSQQELLLLLEKYANQPIRS